MMELVPAIANSWDVGPDAEYFDFHIRDGAKWDDGTPISADDFVFTFRHLSNPDLDTPWVWYYYAIKGIKAHKAGEVSADAVGVEKLDDQTIRVWGEGGSAPHLPALLAYQAACPVPKHRAEANPEHWADDVDGFLSCGPYSLKTWDHNKEMTWEINPYYNGPHKPYIQHLVNPIGAATINEFLSHQTEWLHNLSVADLNFVRADPELNQLLRWYNNYQTDYMALDTMNPPLDNLKLRQALSHAINRDAVVQILGGTVEPAYSLLMPGFPAYNPELKSVQAFDPELARQLLAEAGYPEGKDANGRQLELTITHKRGRPEGRVRAGTVARAPWHQGKLRARRICSLEPAPLRREMQIYKGPYEYDYIDPANFLGLFRSTQRSRITAPRLAERKYDALYDEAGHMTDTEARFAKYQEAERILVEDVGAIFLTRMLIYQIFWPYFHGHPQGHHGP